MACPGGRRPGRARHHDRGDTFGVGVDRRVPRLKTGNAERLPGRAFSLIVDKALPLPFAVVAQLRRGQGHVMVNLRDMVCRDADFDHLDPVAGFQHAVADFGGLDETVARRQADRAALIFINHINPALDAEDQLETDLVEMHHVGHRAAVGNADMAGNHGPAQARGYQIAVLHSGPPDHPGGLISQAPHDKGVFRGGQHQRRVQRVNLHHRAVRGGQAALAIRKAIGVIGQDTDRAGGVLCPLFESQTQAMAGQNRHFRVVSGIDHVQPHPQRLCVERQVGPQLGRGQADFGTCFGHGIPVTLQEPTLYPSSRVCKFRRKPVAKNTDSRGQE